MLEREIERGVRVPADCGLFDWEAGGETSGAAMVEEDLMTFRKNTRSFNGAE